MKDPLHDIPDELQEEQPSGLPNWEQEPPAEPAGLDPADDNDVEEHGRTLNRNTMLLLGLCAAAVVGIFLFGRTQQPAPANAEQKAQESQLDRTLARLVDPRLREQNQASLRDAENMVQVFYDYPTRQQLLREELQRDPFERQDTPRGVALTLAAPGVNLAALQKSLAALKLQSVLQTPSGAKCLISGEVLGEGQQINEFTINKINANSVILTAAQQQFILKL